MDELINQMVGILSQWIGISNHHNVPQLNIFQFCQLYLSKAEIKRKYNLTKKIHVTI